MNPIIIIIIPLVHFRSHRAVIIPTHTYYEALSFPPPIPDEMNGVHLALLLLLLVAFSFAIEDLKVLEGAVGQEVKFVTTTQQASLRSNNKPSGDVNFEQLMDYAYKRAVPFSRSQTLPTKPNQDGACLEYCTFRFFFFFHYLSHFLFLTFGLKSINTQADDLCHLYDGDCAGCLQVEVCSVHKIVLIKGRRSRKTSVAATCILNIISLGRTRRFNFYSKVIVHIFILLLFILCIIG